MTDRVISNGLTKGGMSSPMCSLVPASHGRPEPGYVDMFNVVFTRISGSIWKIRLQEN